MRSKSLQAGEPAGADVRGPTAGGGGGGTCQTKHPRRPPATSTYRPTCCTSRSSAAAWQGAGPSASRLCRLLVAWRGGEASSGTAAPAYEQRAMHAAMLPKPAAAPPSRGAPHAFWFLCLLSFITAQLACSQAALPSSCARRSEHCLSSCADEGSRDAACIAASACWMLAATACTAAARAPSPASPGSGDPEAG